MLDGLAFVKAQKDHGAQPAGSRVLLLGTGGTGSAIAIALLDEGVQQLIVHDVDEARAADLVELLSGHGYDNVATGPPDPTGCDMVCNATPLGMAEGDPLTRECLRLHQQQGRTAPGGRRLDPEGRI